MGSVNIGNTSIDLTASNVNFLVNTANAVVILRRGGSNVATRKFSFHRVGAELTAIDPSQIDYWLSQYSGLVDDISLQLDPIKVSENVGTNIATAEIKHGNEVIGGASDSWYISPGEGPCCEVMN